MRQSLFLLLLLAVLVTTFWALSSTPPKATETPEIPASDLSAEVGVASSEAMDSATGAELRTSVVVNSEAGLPTPSAGSLSENAVDGLQIEVLDDAGQAFQGPVSVYWLRKPDLRDLAVELEREWSKASAERLQAESLTDGRQLGRAPVEMGVPEETGLLFACTLSGAWRGMLAIEPGARGRVTIPMRCGSSLRVRVVTRTEKPLKSLLVQLRSDRDPRFRFSLGSTDEEGRVRLTQPENTDQVFASDEAPYVQVSLPGGEPLRQVVQPADFEPSSEVVLTVDGVGELVVDLIRDSNLPRERLNGWALHADIPEPGAKDLEIWSKAVYGKFEEGSLRGTFRNLPLGQGWNLWFEQAQSGDKLGPFLVVGPTVEHETANVQIALPPPVLLASAVLVDHSGEALLNERLSAAAEWKFGLTGASSFGHWVKTDDAGRVVFTLDSTEAGVPSLLQWELNSMSGDTSWAKSFEPPLGPGVHDLGVWSPRPSERRLVVSGTVTHQGVPASSGHVRLFELLAEAPAPWKPHYLPGKLDENGRFEIHDDKGELDPSSSYFVQGSGEGDVTDRRPIAFGQAGLMLRTLPTGSIEGLLQRSDGERLFGVQHFLVPSGGSLIDAIPITGAASIGNEFHRTAPAGTYDFHAFDTKTQTTLAIVTGILIQDGELTSDPRLNPLILEFGSE